MSQSAQYDETAPGFDPYKHPVPDGEDADVRTPWWSWLIGMAIVGACYEFNIHSVGHHTEHGNGFVSLVAAVGLLRLVLAHRLARSESGRAGAAIGVALVGFVLYFGAVMALDHAGLIHYGFADDRGAD
jgi:hypothetical protein